MSNQGGRGNKTATRFCYGACQKELPATEAGSDDFGMGYRASEVVAFWDYFRPYALTRRAGCRGSTGWGLYKGPIPIVIRAVPRHTQNLNTVTLRSLLLYISRLFSLHLSLATARHGQGSSKGGEPNNTARAVSSKC